MKDYLRQPLPPFSRQDKVIPVYLFQLIKSILHSQGLPIDNLTYRSGVSAEELMHQDTLISFDQSISIIENALKLSGDPAFGLRVGSLEKLSDLGILGFALSCCDDAESTLRILQSYTQTTTNLTTLNLFWDEETLTYEGNPIHPVPTPICRFLVEETLTCFVHLSRESSNIEAKLLELHFTFPEPENSHIYYEYFGLDPIFSAECNKIVMTMEKPLLEMTNPEANTITANLAIKLCDEMLSRQDSQRNLINKIQLILLQEECSFPSAQEVANELGLSERNMRRVLKELDTSFQSISDDVRRDMAISYLEASNLTQEEIAEKLGFSEASSFYRAFKKWTGNPPTAYRKS